MKTNFEEILKFLDKNGIKYEIDDNPSEERIKEIKEKIKKYNEKFGRFNK